jgi:hypothetical protein
MHDLKPPQEMSCVAHDELDWTGQEEERWYCYRPRKLHGLRRGCFLPSLTSTWSWRPRHHHLKIWPPPCSHDYNGHHHRKTRASTHILELGSIWLTLCHVAHKMKLLCHVAHKMKFVTQPPPNRAVRKTQFAWDQVNATRIIVDIDRCHYPSRVRQPALFHLVKMEEHHYRRHSGFARPWTPLSTPFRLRETVYLDVFIDTYKSR